ncbi:MAG: DUF432 domain-containing protein [Nitrosopumilus sp.]|uniref:DUF432 domain-containing protein n=1 Tax=Nitrosopumilus sp. TaxID=2024843 RepID=UPI00247E7994|nr:DUF432 domain-containing protein [Nitrosopumilus sp.]MCV0391675.1 DUF432 domain-containing protein [Nitrosopumilus sp.]
MNTITTNDKEYSGYGEFSISDKLELRLPRTEIYIEKKPDNRFSYYRKNSQNQEIRKSIPKSNGNIKIEMCPILPLNLPAKKTNDLIFLRLAESIFVEKHSTINFLIQFPIEIGIYIINQSDGTKDLFDCFTCEPMHSRFALYGTPEKGNLCMYSKVKLLEKDEFYPYTFAKMRVFITNELNSGILIGKLVFPITDFNIYYLNGSSEVHIDDVTGNVKHISGEDVIDISRNEFDKKNGDWKLVSYSSKEKVNFVMDRGFD